MDKYSCRDFLLHLRGRNNDKTTANPFKQTCTKINIQYAHMHVFAKQKRQKNDEFLARSSICSPYIQGQRMNALYSNVGRDFAYLSIFTFRLLTLTHAWQTLLGTVVPHSWSLLSTLIPSGFNCLWSVL